MRVELVRSDPMDDTSTVETMSILRDPGPEQRETVIFLPKVPRTGGMHCLASADRSYPSRHSASIWRLPADPRRAGSGPRGDLGDLGSTTPGVQSDTARSPERGFALCARADFGADL
jgi:hypothetical protein